MGLCWAFQMQLNELNASYKLSWREKNMLENYVYTAEGLGVHKKETHVELLSFARISISKFEYNSSR